MVSVSRKQLAQGHACVQVSTSVYVASIFTGQVTSGGQVCAQHPTYMHTYIHTYIHTVGVSDECPPHGLLQKLQVEESYSSDTSIV